MRHRLFSRSTIKRPALASPQVQVVIAAVAATLLVIALTAQQLSIERQQSRLSVLRDNQFRVQSFEQYVLRTLEVAVLATQHVQELVRRSPRESLSRSLQKDQTIRAPLFTTVMVETQGLGLVRARTSISIPPATRTRIMNVARSSHGRIIVTEPLAMQGARPQVAVVRALHAGRGGFVAIFIDPRRFTEFADDIPFAQHDLISLIGLDGVTRARRSGNIFSQGEAVSGLVMRRQRAAPNGSYLGPSVLDGIPRFFSHRRLSRFDLFVTSGAPFTLVAERAAQRRSLQINIMAASLVAIIGASWVLINFISRGQRQIDRLKRANRRLVEAQKVGLLGDWDYYPVHDQFFWSDNLRRMYGREHSHKVSSIEDLKLYAGETGLTRIKAEFAQVLQSGERSTWQVEVTLPGGERSCRRFTAGPILRDGRIIGLHGTDQDITKEAKLRMLENRLVELARLDSMRALAATFAHELNQPLAAAANYLGAATHVLSTRGGKDDARMATYLESTKDQIHHIGQIIAGARELVAHSASNSQEVSVPEVIEALKGLLRGTENARDAVLESKVSPAAREVRANAVQLKQVLFNLSRNAIEAVPPSRIPAITYTVEPAQNGQIEFEVSDNGAGFPLSAGDPFATLSTTKQNGLGLGLSLARTIVEAHGGRIWIKNSSPEGATVAFTL